MNGKSYKKFIADQKTSFIDESKTNNISTAIISSYKKHLPSVL